MREAPHQIATKIKRQCRHIVALAVSLFVMLANVSHSNALEQPFEDPLGWINLDQPPSYFVVGETPSEETLQKCRKICSELETPEKSSSNSIRKSARFHWLHLNLEYQYYLSQAVESIQRREAAIAIEKSYRELTTLIWDKGVAYQNGESSAEWAEVKDLMQVIYDSVKVDFPPAPIDAGILVRRHYFDTITPSAEIGVTANLQTTIGDAFHNLQNLAKEAVAAKVQAAVVMRRFYGEAPEVSRFAFVNPERKEEKLSEEHKSLFGDLPETKFEKSTEGENSKYDLPEKTTIPNKQDKEQWALILNLIEGVSSKSGTTGITGDYLRIMRAVGWQDGHLGKVRTLYPDPKLQFEDSAFSKVLVDYTSSDWQQTDSLFAQLDGAYGMPGSSSDDADTSLHKVIVLSNSRAQEMATMIRGREFASSNSTPLGKLLDDSFEFDVWEFDEESKKRVLLREWRLKTEISKSANSTEVTKSESWERGNPTKQFFSLLARGKAVEKERVWLEFDSGSAANEISPTLPPQTDRKDWQYKQIKINDTKSIEIVIPVFTIYPKTEGRTELYSSPSTIPELTPIQQLTRADLAVNELINKPLFGSRHWNSDGIVLADINEQNTSNDAISTGTTDPQNPPSANADQQAEVVVNKSNGENSEAAPVLEPPDLETFDFSERLLWRTKTREINTEEKTGPKTVNNSDLASQLELIRGLYLAFSSSGIFNKKPINDVIEADVRSWLQSKLAPQLGITLPGTKSQITPATDGQATKENKGAK